MMEGMTTLRYFMPIISLLSKKDCEIFLAYPVDGTGLDKYNSVRVNFNAFSALCRNITPRVSIIQVTSQNTFKTDVLFTVECVPRSIEGNYFIYDKKFCIQHGTDYTQFAKNKDSKTTYIALDSQYSEDMNENLGVSAVYPGSPVTFWNIEQQLEFIKPALFGKDSNFKLKSDDKIACIFYPDSEGRKEANAVITHLTNNNYKIFIKQRRKHQHPDNIGFQNTWVIYDDLWYPSESIFIPAISDLCIGFSSAAYCDIVPSEINYVDISITDNSKSPEEQLKNSKWPGYLKPVKSDYFRYVSKDYIDNAILAIESLNCDKTNREINFKKQRELGEKFIDLNL